MEYWQWTGYRILKHYVNLCNNFAFGIIHCERVCLEIFWNADGKNEYQRKTSLRNIVFCNKIYQWYKSLPRSLFRKCWSCMLIAWINTILAGTEAATWYVLVKKLFLKISQYSQENTYAGVFFNKVAGSLQLY